MMVKETNAASSSEILEALSSAIEGVAEGLSSSVVGVGTNGRLGSGIVWDGDGHILTASHLVRRLKTVGVRSSEGGAHEANVIGEDPYSDVALLKTEPNGLKPVKTGDSSTLRVGQFVLGMANPYALKPSATSGIITSLDRTIRGWSGPTLDNAIVTDARLNPGYSGGPLVDASGQVIGLNVAFVSGRGIAVPINQVKTTLERLQHDGSVKTGYLGIVSNPIPFPDEVAELPEVNQSEGLIVLSVEEESPARRGGVAFGDILFKFDSKPVSGLHDLSRYLREDVIGKPISVRVLRGGKSTELTITPRQADE